MNKFFKPTKYVTIPQYQLWNMFCKNVANSLNDAGKLCSKPINFKGESGFMLVPYNLKEVKRESEEILNISNVADLSRAEFADALASFEAYWVKETNFYWNPENYKLKQTIYDVRQLALF